MQYKMIVEILEVAEAMRPGLYANNNEPIVEAFYRLLQDGHDNRELTPKQKRVHNCITSILNSELKRTGKLPQLPVLPMSS